MDDLEYICPTGFDYGTVIARLKSLIGVTDWTQDTLGAGPRFVTVGAAFLPLTTLWECRGIEHPSLRAWDERCAGVLPLPMALRRPTDRQKLMG
jgi:hypothetical protein